MLKSTETVRKGSILPLILELEAELIERERTLKQEVREEVDNAKQAAAQRIDKAENELPGIEAAERQKLLAEINASVEERSSEEDRKYENLKKAVDLNRQQVIEYILKRILPDIESR